MPTLVTTHVVAPDEVERFLVPRTDLLVEQDDGDGVFTLGHGPFVHYRRTVTTGSPTVPPPSTEGHDASQGAGRVEVTETIRYQLAIPVWGFLFARVVRHALGNPQVPGRHPWWAPPDRLDARAASGLSLLCVFSAVAGYLGTLLTQTNTFFKSDFGVTDGQVGFMLASVRIGALLALVLIAIADRRGRRQVLLWSAVAGCVVTATGALAPNLLLLGVSQTLARTFSTALALVISIIAVEEMPSGSRAFAVSVLTATAALGAGQAIILLQVADLAPWAWRVLFVVPLLAVPFVVRFGRRIPETHRFDASAARQARAPARRWFHVPPGVDRGRLALLAASGLFFSLFVIPASSFLNDYLRTERGFSAGMIVLFQILTNTPGGIGLVIGGRLADRRGRRLIGAIGLTAGVGFTVAMYFVSGWPIWACSLLGSLIGAMAVPALGVYGPELFPTGARGAANGIINLASVTGSAIGLAAAGLLSDHLSGLGPAMAVLSLGGVAVIGMVIFLYPETASTTLEDLNPEDSPLSRELLGLRGLDIDIQPERYPRSTDD